MAYHTDSPAQVEDLGSLRLGLVGLCDVLPLTGTPPTFHLPNNSTCGFTVDLAHRLSHWCSIALYFRRGKLGSFMDIAFVWNDVCVCGEY